jgi:hypothetical protein
MHTVHALMAMRRPPPRVPERDLARAVEIALSLTREDGLDRHVVFDAAKRRVSIDTWPVDERPGLAVLADITLEAAS